MILCHPQDVESEWGHITLAVKACGASPLSYQWYFEQNKIPGMLNYIMWIMHITHCFIGGMKSSYTIHFPSKRNIGVYYCQIQNQYGKVDSNPAMVIVKEQYSSSPRSKESTTLHYDEGLTISQIQDSTSPIDLES